MTVRIKYMDGTIVHIHSVEAVQLGGDRTLHLKTFGNDWTMHHKVWSFEVERFTY